MPAVWVPYRVPMDVVGNVEGEKGEGDEYPVVTVDKDCTCYCQTCNKYVNLKAGDRIPPCCGKLMELLD